MLQCHDLEELLKGLETLDEQKEKEEQNFFVEIGSVVFDTKTKEVLQVNRFKKANSLLKQLFQMLGVQATQSTWVVKRTDGANINLNPGTYNFRVTAGDADTSYGIVIGTGTNPVSLSDFRLQNQVTSNIVHRTTVVGLENPSSSRWSTLIYRTFTNNTGSSLTISEVALYSTPGVGNYFCLDRTLYSLEVPAGQSFLIAYRISILLS